MAEMRVKNEEVISAVAVSSGRDFAVGEEPLKQ